MKKTTKLITMFMALVIVLTSLPISAMTLPITSSEKITSETFSTFDGLPDNVYVMAEATEKRGEFEKHYILSDGSMVAVSYPEAVHYKNDSGKWEDVDNTFKYDAKSKRYTGGKGNTIFSFSESVSSGDLVAIKDNHGSMAWSLGIVRKNNTEKGQSSTAKAKVGTINSTKKSSYSLKENEAFDLPKTVGKIQYDTLFSDAPEISVDYSVYHNKIEEDIYINSPTDLTSFTMNVQIGDLYGEVNKDGSVYFKNENNEIIYKIGVPYMHDCADAVLNDITVTLDQSGDTCTVTYTPNSEWLQSEDREYPILFDPSITTSEYRSNITDTYVMQGDTANHSSQQTMFVGVNAGSICRSYIKIGTLPAIDPSMPVLSATMTLSLWVGTSTGKTVGVYKANAYWDANTITYASQPATTQLGTCEFNASDLHYTFDLTSDVSKVYDEFLAGINYGYMLRYVDESTTDPDYNSIYSSEFSTKSYRPVLKIVYGYALPDNLQSGNTYSIQNAESMSFVTVCNGTDANGTNVIQKYNYIEDITENQQFKLEYVPSTGGYIFRALCSSNGTNRVLDIVKNNGYVENGCNVQIYQNNDSIAQEWFIIGVDTLTYKIIPRSNMNLALTVSSSIDDGSADGTSFSSPGNIFVSDFFEDNNYQLWYIVENGDYVDCEYDSKKVVENATYYINNKASGQYLHNDGTSTVKTQSGMIAYLTDSIRWNISYVGNGYCTIQSTVDLTQYLGRTTGYAIGYVNCTSESNIPESCLWTVERADEGGVNLSFVYNGRKYYATQSSSNTIVSASGATDSATWRIASTDFYGNTGDTDYTELHGNFSVDDISLLIGESATPKINNPDRALWMSPSDFTYSIVINADEGYVEYDSANVLFYALKEGNVNVGAKHKTTGYTKYFDITVDLLEIVVPCLYATSTEYDGVRNFPVYLSNYIDEYSDYLTGVSWNASENGIITFDDENMTVLGYSTGLAWLEATKNNTTVCVCYVYVDDAYKEWPEDIRNFLWLDSHIISSASVDTYNVYHTVDPLILRAEWFFYIVELKRQGLGTKAIGEEMDEKFGLDLSTKGLTGLTFLQEFVGTVDLAMNGGYRRENLKLSFDGLRDLLDFYWFQYAFYAIANLDTVNVYTPATLDDVINEENYARNLFRPHKEKTIEIYHTLTKNPTKTTTVIGTTYDNVSWHEVGEALDARYFFGPEYNYYSSYYPNDVKLANKMFIVDTLKGGGTLYCSQDPSWYFDLETAEIIFNNGFGQELKWIYDTCSSVSFEPMQTINGKQVWEIIYHYNN